MKTLLLQYFERLEDESVDDFSADEKERTDLERETSRKLTDLDDNVREDFPDKGAPAGIHETAQSDADISARVKRKFDRFLRRSDRKWAKQAKREDRKMDIVSHTNQINKLEQDKFDIVREAIKYRTKNELRQGDVDRKERRQIYTALTKEFINFWDEDPKGYGATDGVMPEQVDIEHHRTEFDSPLTFTKAEYGTMFDKLAAKDAKMDEYFKERELREIEYDNLQTSGDDVTKDELKDSEVFSDREARRIARFDRRQDRQAPKAERLDEKANTVYNKYSAEIGEVLTITTSVDVYSKKGKRKEQLDKQTREAERFDKLALLTCDYNMDGDVTPKPLKEWFRKNNGKVKTNRYARKSRGENPLTISASELRECMYIARTEVTEEKLVQNIIQIINNNIYKNTEHLTSEVVPLSTSITTSDALFAEIGTDYHYVETFREALANYSGNVTDFLTLGGLMTPEGKNQYLEETGELIAFDRVKAHTIAEDLAQLDLATVESVWNEMIKEVKGPDTEEGKALIDFKSQVNDKADHQRLIMLKRLRTVKDKNPPTNPVELAQLDAQIRDLSDEQEATKHLTLQGLMAFMMFNYQGLDIKERISNADGTRTIEEGYTNEKGTWVRYTKTVTKLSDGTVISQEGDYSLKEKLARTSLNAFGIGAGGSLVNFKKRKPRFADNISWGVNAISNMGFDTKEFNHDVAAQDKRVAEHGNEPIPDDIDITKKEYIQRGYGLSLSVGYNGSVGLGERIGNTQYYPAQISFGTGVGGGLNTVQGWSLGAYAYAGPNWMRNAGKLQHTLDTKSSKESGVTGTVGFDILNNSRGANVQFSMIKKDHIKGYEVVADSIRTTGVDVVTHVIKQLQLTADPGTGKIAGMTPEKLKDVIRDALTYDHRFDRTRENSVALDRMATRMFRMMKTLYPGIDTPEGADSLGDLDNSEIAQGVANNLAYHLSLNWLNENYDKLKGLKWSGLSMDATTVLMILGGVMLPVAVAALSGAAPIFFIGAAASFAFNNMDWMRKSNIQEEDATTKRNAEIMKTYNIGARKIEGNLIDHVEHVNEKIRILTNTKHIIETDPVTGEASDEIRDYLKPMDDGTVLISNALLSYSSTVPVYLNPIYKEFYKKVEDAKVGGDKHQTGLLVPGKLAAGIMTSVGKTKDGALYIGYEAKDRNIFQDEVGGEDDKEAWKQSAVLWTGQEYGGHPETFNTANGYKSGEWKALWETDAAKNFELPKTTYDIAFTAPHTLKVLDKGTKTVVREVDMSNEDLVFNSTQQSDDSFVLSGVPEVEPRTVASGPFVLKHTRQLKDSVGAVGETVKTDVSFDYKTFDRDFNEVIGKIDPNKNRSQLKSFRTADGKQPYTELSHIMDSYTTIDRKKAADYANQIITYGKLGTFRFDETKKEELMRFMHELIGSKYCVTDPNKKTVEVGKGGGFGAMMTSRTAGFENRWRKDTDTNKVPVPTMLSVRDASLQGMFSAAPTLGLTLANYRKETRSVSFDEGASDSWGEPPILGVIYGYNGANGTHNEKLVQNPRIVKGSDVPIADASFRKYTLNQVKGRYDSVYGANGFLNAIGKQIGATGLTNADIQGILDGTTDKVTVNGGTLTISSHFFFYPECFNEGVGIRVKFEKAGSGQMIAGTKETLKGELGSYQSTGATGMFVNNITMGMGTDKRSIKGAVGLGLQVLPTSRTIIPPRKPDSKTTIETTDLNEIPGYNINDGTITVTYNGQDLVLSPANGHDSSQGYTFRDPTNSDNLIAGMSMEKILETFGSGIDISQQTNLTTYDHTLTYQGQTVTIPGVAGDPIVTQNQIVVPLGHKDQGANQIIQNAQDLQGPNRNQKQVKERLEDPEPK